MSCRLDWISMSLPKQGGVWSFACVLGTSQLLEGLFEPTLHKAGNEVNTDVLAKGGPQFPLSNVFHFFRCSWPFPNILNRFQTKSCVNYLPASTVLGDF